MSLTEATRYHKISHDPAANESLFAKLFLEAHKTPPAEITIDLNATDDPPHGHQEGRFFHGYYDCYYYLPLYIFCGKELLAAKLRPTNIDAAAGCIRGKPEEVQCRHQRLRPHIRRVFYCRVQAAEAGWSFGR